MGEVVTQSGLGELIVDFTEKNVVAKYLKREKGITFY